MRLVSSALSRLTRQPATLGWVNEPDSFYRAANGLNYSSLKILCEKTPAHFLHALENPKAPTPAMMWGSVVHAFLLDGKAFTIEPDFSGKGSKAAREEWRAALPADALIVAADEAESLYAMARALRAHPVAVVALTSEHREISGYATTDLFGLKLRADLLSPDEGVIWDLKTCASAAPNKFSRDAFDLGYHLQAAWYLTVANLIEPGTYHAFRWICVEKDAPYCVAVYEATEEHLALGSQAIGRALDVLTSCLDDGGFHGFPADVVPLEVPRWAARQIEGGES